MTYVKTNKSDKTKDPVCGMDVSSENVGFKLDFDDTTYYFCARACKEKFEKSPEIYLSKSSFFLKRLWDNYLVRLNKITNGKAQCCD